MYGVQRQAPLLHDQSAARFIREGNSHFGDASSLVSGGMGERHSLRPRMEQVYVALY